MSLFGSIVDKIVHYAASAMSPASDAAPHEAAGAPATAAPDAAAPAPAPAASAGATPLAAIDVGATLTALAEKKGGGLHWQSSIVDLLKLLDLDSSLTARKTLAQELGVHAGEDGSAEQNIALHRAVVAKLAENGGTLPASL